MRLARTSVALLLLLGIVLVGCNGGGGGGPGGSANAGSAPSGEQPASDLPPQLQAVPGLASKGPLHGASVNQYADRNRSQHGAVVSHPARGGGRSVTDARLAGRSAEIHC